MGNHFHNWPSIYHLQIRFEMIKALELDRIYTHKRNKQQYRLIFFGKVQIKGQWRDAVIYQAEAGMDETMYIRTALNFKKRFIE